MQHRVNTSFKIINLLSVIFLIGYTSLFAQNSANIKIKVKDTNNAAIAGANVVLRNSKPGFERSPVNDVDGSFTFKSLGNETYEVSVLANGFARDTKQIQSTSKAEFVLKPSSVEAETAIYSGSH